MPADKSHPRKISYAELKKRCETADLSAEELRAYFAEDKERSKAFQPALKVDETSVDLTGHRKPTPRQVAELYQQATRTPQKSVEGAVPTVTPKSLTAKTKSMAKSLKATDARVLGEGDSWFNLPAVIYPPTALDVLAETHDVRSIAMWGDELDQMVAAKQYLQPLKSGAFRHFLFSGGGNDVLGSIPKYVKKHQAGKTDPAHYVNADFAAKIDELMKAYGKLADDVRTATKGGTVLYVHGYANGIPRKNGRYIGGPLEALGFGPETALAKGIVRHMVAMFNTALKAFAASRSNVVYVDMRGAMNASDWIADEIHPRKSGSEKIAALFKAAMAKNNLTS